MSAHISQAFSIAHSTDSEDLPLRLHNVNGIAVDKMLSCMLVSSHTWMRSAALAERHSPP